MDHSPSPPDLGTVGVYSGLFRTGLGSVEAEQVAELEQLGYGTLWVPDAVPDLSPVEQLLSATKRVTVATGVVSIWSSSAPDLAAAYARVEAGSPGRAIVGIGISHAPLVEPQGQRWDRPVERMTEYLDELDAADPPIPRERRIIGANGPRMLELSATRSAGAHPYLVTPAHTQQARATLGDAPLLAPEQKVILDRDPTSARALARARLAVYFGLPNYVRSWRRMGYGDDDLADGGSDRLIDALIAWGDVDALTARVHEHLAAGANHIAVHVLTEARTTPMETWRSLAEALIERTTDG